MSGDAGEAGHILVAESDGDLGRAMVEQFAADGYRAQLALTAAHARSLAAGNAPELVVLGDLGSPRGALELLGEIRSPGRTGSPWREGLPAIVVGRHSQEPDLLRAFDKGADDFIARPASYLELRARTRALLRRTGGAAAGSRALLLDSLAIDMHTRVVSLHGEALTLRRLEFALLAHLARDPERVFAREELLSAVWGYRSRGCSRTVDSHASRLRRKLEVLSERRWVINVWGVGYRLM